MDRFSITQAIQPKTNDGQSPTCLQPGARGDTRPSSTASSRTPRVSSTRPCSGVGGHEWTTTHLEGAWACISGHDNGPVRTLIDQNLWAAAARLEDISGTHETDGDSSADSADLKGAAG